jgi:capsular polysaccharide transport system permease protein
MTALGATARNCLALLRGRPLWLAAAVLIVLSTLYWGLFAANRYVSEAHVVVENVQSPAGSTVMDLSSVLGGNSAAGKDMLLLRDYLLSADMLRALDAKLDLRTHYSSSYDVFSRMLYRKVSAEWFLRHYQSRVEVTYDDYAGLLVITAQAYTPAMAQAIAQSMVQEGERFMNELGHRLAREQVTFAEREVADANKRMLGARQAVMAYQNQHGLVSPTSTVENIAATTARLDGELSSMLARRHALEAYLAPNAPDLQQVNMQIRALEKQLDADRARLASLNGKPLNRLAEEFDRLALEAGFQQDVYKTAIAALERSRLDATRLLKKLSVVQQPTLPEYSVEPARLYSVTLYALVILLCAGIVQLLLTIIREHRD